MPEGSFEHDANIFFWLDVNVRRCVIMQLKGIKWLKGLEGENNGLKKVEERERREKKKKKYRVFAHTHTPQVTTVSDIANFIV